MQKKTAKEIAIKEDIFKVLEKHDIKEFIILIKQPVKSAPGRVIAGVDESLGITKKEDMVCRLAELFEYGINCSEQFRNIITHASEHSMHHILELVKLEMGGKKVD